MESNQKCFSSHFKSEFTCDLAFELWEESLPLVSNHMNTNICVTNHLWTFLTAVTMGVEPVLVVGLDVLACESSSCMFY